MEVAAWKSLAELGMGMVSLVAVVIISLRLLSIVAETHKEIRAIRLELNRAIGYMQAYMSRHGIKLRKKEDSTWTGKQS